MNFGNPGEDKDVSERDTTSEKTQDASIDEEMRSIPDGGLTDGLPEWLRRPPAWRDLPRKDEEQQRTLPEPDTSVIDPRTLIDVGDLPPWLQAIAARGEKPAKPSPDDLDIRMQEDATMQANDPNRNQAEEPVERDVAFEPVDKKRWEVPEEETKVYGGGPTSGPNTMMMFGATIVIILVIAIGVFLYMI